MEHAIKEWAEGSQKSLDFTDALASRSVLSLHAVVYLTFFLAMSIISNRGSSLRTSVLLMLVVFAMISFIKSCMSLVHLLLLSNRSSISCHSNKTFLIEATGIIEMDGVDLDALEESAMTADRLDAAQADSTLPLTYP